MTMTTKPSAQMTRKVFDYVTRKIVTVDNDDRQDGVPVLTSRAIRLLRGPNLKQAVHELGLTRELFEKWMPVVKTEFLCTLDSRGHYKPTHNMDFEDEDAMARSAVSYKNLNLPPEALARLKALKKKKGYEW